MTKKEMELKFQQLNLEYMEKSADINRRKEEVVRRKRGFLQSARDNANAMKKTIVWKCAELRKQLGKCDDDRQREDLRQQIRQLECEIGVGKSEKESVINRIYTEALDARMKLDNEARMLEIWLEREKMKIRQQNAQDPEEPTE